MNRNVSSTIIFIVIVVMVSFCLSELSSARIGTCYNSSLKPSPVIDENFTDKTSIESFRFDLSWGIMDHFLADSCQDTSCLISKILSAYPDDPYITNIFMFKFWHDEKMDIPAGGDDKYVYPVDSAYWNDLKYWCYFLADSLSNHGIHHYVLHNEPNFWWGLTGPPYEGPNWMGSAKEYAAQCESCAVQIKDADNQAYIIYGSFAGSDVYGVDTSGAIAAMTDSMDLSLVDCIDFHYYMDSTTVSTTVNIANKIKAFVVARSRGLDWSVLETAGPLLQFPEYYHYSEYDSVLIYTMLKNYVIRNLQGWDWGYDDSIFIDSLYYYSGEEDECNLLLPDNWYENGNCSNLEDFKIGEFDARVPVLDTMGAKFVHWFSAWRQLPYHYHLDQNGFGCYDPECQGVENWTAEDITGTLFKQAKWFPRCILNPEDTTVQTPFAEHMQDYIFWREEFYNRQGTGNPMQYIHDNAEHLWISNYPNTFNARTRIDFFIPESGHTKLNVYDILGRRVTTLVDEFRERGSYAVIWDAESHPTGVYFCHLSQGSSEMTTKMGLVK